MKFKLLTPYWSSVFKAIGIVLYFQACVADSMPMLTNSLRATGQVPLKPSTLVYLNRACGLSEQA